MKFKKGDRVAITAEAIQNGVFINTMHKPMTGIIASNQKKDDLCITVLRDGDKTTQRFHCKYWRHYP